VCDVTYVHQTIHIQRGVSDVTPIHQTVHMQRGVCDVTPVNDSGSFGTDTHGRPS
jgi:hypothetical protein